VFLKKAPPHLSHSGMSPKQGDQIGRIFAQWEIIYFGRLVENRKSSPYFCATFSLSTGLCICDILIVTKIGLGYILGNFFTNSSGHPGPKLCVTQWVNWYGNGMAAKEPLYPGKNFCVIVSQISGRVQVARAGVLGPDCPGAHFVNIHFGPKDFGQFSSD
jgi:hypothetical protein